MVWINIPLLSKACNDFIKNNKQLKLSKLVCRNGTFVFYREDTNYVTKERHEFPEFRIVLVRDEKGNVGWCVSYMRHTGKWHNLPIFGDFDYCLDEIKSRKWAVLNPI